jgi:integrase
MNETGFYLFQKNGIYYLGFTDEDGIRRQKSTKCKIKHEAVKKVSDFKKFLSEEHTAKRISISKFKTEFLGYAKTNYASHTVYLYEQMLSHFIRICGDLPLSKYTPKHYDLYKVTRLKEFVRGKIPKKAEKRVMNPITVNIELRSLRAVFNTARRWEYIEKNPFDGMSQIPIPKRTPAFMTADDVENMLKVITRPWLKDVLIFAVNTGMRRGELLSLRWQDVDVKLRVARIVNRDDFTTKSGEERVVALNDAALAVVQRCVKSEKHEYLFSREDGIRLLPDWLTAAFKDAARNAGLSEGIHLHSTRHSFASLLVGNGTSLFTVSKLLGHSNAKTSEIYSHLLPQHLHNEVDKLNVGGNPKTSMN